MCTRWPPPAAPAVSTWTRAIPQRRSNGERTRLTTCTRLVRTRLTCRAHAPLRNSSVSPDQAKAVDVNTTYAPRLRAAAAFALAHATSAAESEIRRFRDLRPEDTILHRVYLPTAEAALHLSRREFDRVVEVLRAGSPYEHGIVAALLPMLLRGQAQLRAGAFSEAVSEFQSVLQHRGADPFSPAIPLARLGLARALRELGDRSGAARAYQELLAIWRDADGDVPVVREARAEAEAEIRR